MFHPGHARFKKFYIKEHDTAGIDLIKRLVIFFKCSYLLKSFPYFFLKMMKIKMMVKGREGLSCYNYRHFNDSYVQRNPPLKENLQY